MRAQQSYVLGILIIDAGLPLALETSRMYSIINQLWLELPTRAIALDFLAFQAVI